MIRRNFFADGRHSSLSSSTTLGMLLVCSRMAFVAKPHACMYAANVNSDETTTSGHAQKILVSNEGQKTTSPSPSSLFVSKHLATLRRRQEVCPHLFLIKKPYSGHDSRPVTSGSQSPTTGPTTTSPILNIPFGIIGGGIKSPPQGHDATGMLSIEQQCEWCGACRILQLTNLNNSNPSVGVVDVRGSSSSLSRRYAHARRLFEHLTPIVGDDAAEEPWVDLSYNVHSALVALDLHLKGASVADGGSSVNSAAAASDGGDGGAADSGFSSSPALTKFLSSLTAQVSAKAMYKHAELRRSAREQQKAQSDGETTPQTYPTPSTPSSSPSSSLLQHTYEKMTEPFVEGNPTSKSSDEEGKVTKRDGGDVRSDHVGAEGKTPFFVPAYRISDPKRQLITIDDLYNYVPHYKNIASAFPSIPYQKHVGTLPEIVKYFSSVAKKECLARYLTSETERELGHYVPRVALANHQFSPIGSSSSPSPTFLAEDESPIATASQYTLFRHPKCVFEGKKKSIVAPAPSAGTTVLKRGPQIGNKNKTVDGGRMAEEASETRSSENLLPDSLVVKAEQQQQYQHFSLEFIQSSLRATKFCAVVYGTAYEGHFFDSLLSVGKVRSFLEVYQSSHRSQLAAARRMASSNVGFMPNGTVWSVREQRYIGEGHRDDSALSGKSNQGRSTNETTSSTISIGSGSATRGHNIIRSNEKADDDNNDDGSPVPVVEIVAGNWTNVPWGVTYVIALDHQHQEITLAFRGTFADAGIIVDIHNGPISLFTHEEKARLGINRTVKATEGSEKESEEAEVKTKGSQQTSSSFPSFSSSTFSGPFGFIMGVRPGSPQTQKIDEELLRLALIEYPHYRVVVTGHSLGAAYASNFVASRLLFGALAREQGLYEPVNENNNAFDIFLKEKNKQLGELMSAVRESVLRCEEQEEGAAVDQQAENGYTEKADTGSSSFIKLERRPIFNKTLDDLFNRSIRKDTGNNNISVGESVGGIQGIDFADPFVVSGLYMNGFITRNNTSAARETSPPTPTYRSTLEDLLTVCGFAPPASANMAWRQALEHFFPKLDLRSFVHDTDVVTRLQIASLRIVQETINNSEVIPNVFQRALNSLKSSLVPPIAKTISPIASLLSKQLSVASAGDKSDAKKDNNDNNNGTDDDQTTNYYTGITSDNAAVNDMDSEVDEVVSSEHKVYRNIHDHLEKELGDIKKLLETSPTSYEALISNASSGDVGDEQAKRGPEISTSTASTTKTPSDATSGEAKSTIGEAVASFAQKALPSPLSSLLVARCPTEQMQNLEDLRTCFTFIEKERQRSEIQEVEGNQSIAGKGKSDGGKQPLANSTETVAGGGDPSSLLEPIPRQDSIDNIWVPLGKIYLLGRGGQEHMTAPRLMASHLTDEEKKIREEGHRREGCDGDLIGEGGTKTQKPYSTSSDFLRKMEKEAIADLFKPKIVSLFAESDDKCSNDDKIEHFKGVHAYCRVKGGSQQVNNAEGGETKEGDGENTQLTAESCELYDIPDASFDIATAFNSQRRTATMAMIADPLVPSLSIPIIDVRSAQNHFLFRYGRALLDLAVSSDESDKRE